MKYLTLVRHAQPEKDSSTGIDIDRPLAAKGIEDTKNIAGQMKKSGLLPDRILSSDALRARETAVALCEALGCERAIISSMEELYNASGKGILDIVRRISDDAETVFLVGHNPGLTEALGGFCSGEERSMRPGDAAHIELPADSWALTTYGNGTLTAYLKPDA